MEQRLIDANALKYRRQFKVGKPIEYLGKYDILTAPTVDAVQVVRCRECQCEVSTEKMREVSGASWCKYKLQPCQPNDFCSYGEPRTPPAERP